MTRHEVALEWLVDAAKKSSHGAHVGIGVDRIKYALEAANLTDMQRLDALTRALAEEIGNPDLSDVLERMTAITRADATVHWDAARELRNAAIGVCEDWGIE